MAVQLIAYDLRKPGQKYHQLTAAIQSLGDYWHCLESVWLVKTSLTTVQVRDTLKPYLDMNDSLLVSGLNGNWGTLGIGTECTNWLYANVGR